MNYVTVCDATGGTVIKQLLPQPDVSLSYELGQPAVTPDGQYMDVPYTYDPVRQLVLGQVVMLNANSGKIVRSPITVGNQPVWLQMAPNGDTLYVAKKSSGSIT